MNAKSSALLKTTAILAIGKLSAYAATFLVIPLYTNKLSAADYGLLDLLTVYVALFVPLITLRLEASVFRWITEIRDDATVPSGPYLKFPLVWLALASTVLLVVCGAAGWYMQNVAFVIFAGLVVLQAFNALLLEFVRAHGFSSSFTVAGIINGFALLLTTYFFLDVMELGILGAWYAIGLSSVLSSGFCLLKIIKIYRPGGALTKEQRREMLRFSWPLVLSAAAWYLILVSDRTLISAVLGLSANGIFAVANKFATVLLVVFPIFGMALTESAILSFRTPDRDQFFNTTYNMAVRASAALAVLMTGGVFLYFPILVGAGYDTARPLVPLLILGAFFNNMVTLYDPIHIADCSTRKILQGSILVLILNFAVHLALITWLGLYAAAIASVVALGAVSVWRHRQAHRIVPVQYTRETLVLVGLAFAATAACYYLPFPMHGMLSCLVSLGMTGLLLWPLVQKKLLRRDHAL